MVGAWPTRPTHCGDHARRQDLGVGRKTRKLILGDLDADYGKGVIRLKSSGPVEELCEQATHAIAVTGVSSARQRDLKILAIDGLQPTAENIASAKYPYFRPRFLAHPPRLDSRQSNFLNWVLGPEGQAIIRSCGTVNLADGIKLVRRFDQYGDPTLITNLPRLQTQADEFERELKHRAAEELAAARPQE